jgi:hypothetical protein
VTVNLLRPIVSNCVLVSVYEHHCSLNAFHFAIDGRLLSDLLSLFLHLLFVSQESKFKELLRDFDVIRIGFKCWVRMVKIEEQFIPSPVENSDDLAVLHDPYNSAVLENTLDCFVVIRCKVPQVFNFHLFEDSVRTTCHNCAFCDLLSFILNLGNRSILCVLIYERLLEDDKRICEHLLRIVNWTCDTFFVFNTMHDKRDCVACKVPQRNDICQVRL